MGRRAAQQARDWRQAVRRGTARALCGADQRVAYACACDARRRWLRGLRWDRPGHRRSVVRVVRVVLDNTTLLALKLRKTGRELVAPLRWSPLDAHCTRACHGYLVCVVGALG